MSVFAHEGDEGHTRLFPYFNRKPGGCGDRGSSPVRSHHAAPCTERMIRQIHVIQLAHLFNDVLGQAETECKVFQVIRRRHHHRVGNSVVYQGERASDPSNLSSARHALRRRPLRLRAILRAPNGARMPCCCGKSPVYTESGCSNPCWLFAKAL